DVRLRHRGLPQPAEQRRPQGRPGLPPQHRRLAGRTGALQRHVQALLSVIDLRTDTESASQTINTNRGINFEPPGPTKAFLGVPWAIAFEHRSNVGYAIAAAANVAVKVVLDANGTPTLNAPAAAGDPGSIVRVFVG